MGHRGIYTVISNGQRAFYYTHYGVASPFSIFRRLLCVLELKEGDRTDKSLIDIFANVGDNGEYLSDVDGHRMFERISVREKRRYKNDFNNCGYLEMRVTLNFDNNTAFLEHNPRYCHYKNVGNYCLPLNQGIHNIKTVLSYTKNAGIDDVIQVAAAFERHTGMQYVYQNAHDLYDAEKSMEEHSIAPHSSEDNRTFERIAEKSEAIKAYDDLER